MHQQGHILIVLALVVVVVMIADGLWLGEPLKRMQDTKCLHTLNLK